MSNHIMQGYTELILALAGTPGVIAAGKSGGAQLPLGGESDIDIFVFCDQIPPLEVRSNLLSGAGGGDAHLSEHAGRFWGVCDFITIGQAEVCLMYFTTADMDAQLASVLSGERLDREDGYFYPTGRCATMLSMHPLFDPAGYIAGAQRRLSVYPDALAEKLTRHHLRKIDDEEDFLRAVSRGEALMFHGTLDIALDHYLQALFALNRRFFPSRKRTLSYIEGFTRKPEACEKRLLEVVELGAKAQSLPAAYERWKALCCELRLIADEAVSVHG